MAEGMATAPSIAVGALQTAPRRLGGRLIGAIERWLEAERDQLALWLPVALASGITAWFVLPDQPAWTAAFIAALGLSAIGLALGHDRRIGRALAIAGTTAALGLALVWMRSETVAAPRLARPQVASFDARIDGIARMPEHAIRLTLSPGDSSLPPRLRVNVTAENAPAGLAIGQQVRLRARLVPPPSAALPGAYDFSRIAWFDRLGATGKALDPVKIIAQPSRRAPGDWLADARNRLTGHILASLDDGPGAIAAAFVTGDQGAISEADADAMRRSGLAHLLSISGLHVAAVVGAAMLLTMRLLALSPRLALNWPLPLLAALAGAVAGIGYTLLSGAQVPTVRSCIAALIVLAGLAIGREAMTLRLVAVGALLILLFRPEAAAGPSFQLSFAAATAIIALHDGQLMRRWVGRRDEGWLARILRMIASLLITGLAVEIALMPIAVFYFHRAGLYGAMANIVAIPLTTFVIMPLEALALLFDLVGWGGPFWWLTGRALALLLGLAHQVAALPGAVAALPTMPRAAYGLMLAGGLWLMLWRTRFRFAGLAPLAIGAVWALATPPPDLLVTGDGQHLAIRASDGRVALLRPRAGDYVRGMLNENAGVDPAETAGDIDSLAGARCNRDLCAVALSRGGRQWHVLATRSRDLVAVPALAAACRKADIVISDRRLPRSCRPRWLKADRGLLSHTGGLAVNLAPARLDSVADHLGRHPWASLQ
jgi:competence protein ComEC